MNIITMYMYMTFLHSLKESIYIIGRVFSITFTLGFLLFGLPMFFADALVLF